MHRFSDAIGLVSSISHGVKNYFSGLWGTGISDAIFLYSFHREGQSYSSMTVRQEKPDGHDQGRVPRSCNGISHRIDKFEGGPKYRKVAAHNSVDGQCCCPNGICHCLENCSKTDENNNHPKDRSWIVKKLQYQRSVRRLPWWLRWLKEREHFIDDNLEVAKVQKELFGRYFTYITFV